MKNPFHDPQVLRERLIELADMAERTAHMIGAGLAEFEAHEIERAIRAADAMRSPLLDVQQTHRHSPNHPYGAAMRARGATNL